jgi:hypothetical protein
MKPEAADYLGKARQCLDDARQIAAATPLHHIVAQEAYLAAYHAAEAYLFERTGKGRQDASGLAERVQPPGPQRAAHRSGVHDFPCRSLRVQIHCRLQRGLGFPPITADDARSAIDTAARLIDSIAALLA